jgi:putative adhesin
MQRILLSTTLAATFLAAASPARAQDFRWHGSIAQGQAIEIKGVNGDIRAEASGSNEVEVVAEKHARHDDPASVQIQVVPHPGGVTICAVYPTPSGRQPNECAPGDGGRSNVQNNDVTVRFIVKVPAGVGFTGKTVNGEVSAERLNGDLALSTVNGSISFSTTGLARANTVNGSIKGEMGRADWTDRLSMATVNGGIALTLPASLSADLHAQTVNGDIDTDFPVTITKVDRRRVDGTIGGGGRSLSLESVNGSISIKRE